MTARRLILDAAAVLTWLRAEPGAATIGHLLAQAVIPAPALAEALHLAQTNGHRLTGAALRIRLLGLGALIEPFTDLDAVRTADILSQPGPDGAGLSLGQACTQAIAERLHLPLADLSALRQPLDTNPPPS